MAAAAWLTARAVPLPVGLPPLAPRARVGRDRWLARGGVGRYHRRAVRQRSVDVAVIGAGMAGLTAAALLAKRGRRVALFEQHDRAGGYCSSFARDGYVFDVGVDSVCGLGPKGRTGRILELAGVGEDLPRVRLPDVRGNVFPGERFVVPDSMDRHREQLRRRFRADAEGIDRLFAAMTAIADAAALVPPDRLWDGHPALQRHPELDRWRRATFLDLVRHHVRDPVAWAWLCERVPYVALPPSQVSAVTMSVLVASYFRGGAWRVRGGFQRLADALVGSIRESGGAVALGCPVTEILMERGGAAGVRTGDGRAWPAAAVIHGGDLTTAVTRLLPPEVAAPMRRRVEHADPSLSLFLCYIGAALDLTDFRLPSSLGVFPSTDVELAYHVHESATGASPGTGFGVEIPTLHDPSLAPPGRHVVIVHYPTRHDAVATPAGADALVANILDRLEATLLPRLRDRIEVLCTATPRTLERYTWNRAGSPYGFAQTPERYRLLRDLSALAVPGLSLAGHWTDYGGGVPCAVASGYVKANLLSGAPIGRAVPAAAAVV